MMATKRTHKKLWNELLSLMDELDETEWEDNPQAFNRAKLIAKRFFYQKPERKEQAIRITNLKGEILVFRSINKFINRLGVEPKLVDSWLYKHGGVIPDGPLEGCKIEFVYRG